MKKIGTNGWTKNCVIFTHIEKMPFGISGIFLLLLWREQDRNLVNRFANDQRTVIIACITYSLYVEQGEGWFELLNAYCVPDSLLWAANTD
jgi:hypothetical protein